MINNVHIIFLTKTNAKLNKSIRLVFIHKYALLFQSIFIVQEVLYDMRRSIQANK